MSRVQIRVDRWPYKLPVDAVTDAAYTSEAASDCASPHGAAMAADVAATATAVAVEEWRSLIHHLLAATTVRTDLLNLN